MHWERQKNKLTRIQIRKAQSWGCHGNLQQAPSLALSVTGVGSRLARLGLPFLGLTLDTGGGKSTTRGTSALFSIQQVCLVWASTVSWNKVTSLPNQYPHEWTTLCFPHPRVGCSSMGPLAAWWIEQFHVETLAGLASVSGLWPLAQVDVQ